MDKFNNGNIQTGDDLGGHGDEMTEKMDAIENVVELLDTAVDVVKVQSQKLCSAIPTQNLRRLISVPYTLVSDYVVGDHGSLVRAAAELLPVAAKGRVCVHYALTNTGPRYECNIDSSTLADTERMLEEADGPEEGIALRCEYYGTPKCPTVSPASNIRPRGTYQSSSPVTDPIVQPSSSFDSATLTDNDKQRVMVLEEEMKALKEQLMLLTKSRQNEKGFDSARGSPPPEPSTSAFIPAPPPPPPPPPASFPLPTPRLSIAQNAKNVDVDARPSIRPSMKDILKDLSSAKDNLKPVPFSKSPGGTPLMRRRRTSGNNFSDQSMDHGALIAEALRKKFAGINGDQSPQRGSENRGDDEWNSSFDDTPTGTPRQEGDGRRISASRGSRRSSMSTPIRIKDDEE